MLTYFLVQWGSTLGALLLLAMSGAWTLWAFRERERPFLWLATPLAGIATLSLSLSFLYVLCRLTVPVAFVVSLLVNGSASLAIVWRRGREILPRRRRDLVFGLAALFVVTAGAVRVVQGTALRQREPTILLAAGSDMYGYSHMGDWMLRHPHETPVASPDRPYESFLEILVNYDTRHGAFLLAASAAWCRGTSTLFSLDFATGVAWSAALLGFAAAFARRPLLFVSLIGAVALSVWLRNARTGYFGKTLATPGCLLLAHVFLRTWQTRTAWRVVSCLVLAIGFGLCHTPSLLIAAVGLVFMGIAFARFSRWAFDRLNWSGSCEGEPGTGSLWKGLLLAAAMVLPLGAIFSAHLISVGKQTLDSFAIPVGLGCLGIVLARFLSWGLDRLRRRGPSDLQPETGSLWKGLLLATGMVLPLGVIFSAHLVSVSKQSVDHFAAPVDRVAAEALDLGTLWDTAEAERERAYLVGAALAFAFVGFFWALATRAVTAAGLILSSAVPLACWCTGQVWSVYQTQGMLYPLTLAGAALLLQQAAVRRSRWVRFAAIGLVLSLAAVRAPQFHRTLELCTDCTRKKPPFIAQSQVAAVVNQVGQRVVDLCHYDGRVCLTLLLELGARGIPFQLREPAWTTALAYRHWDAPAYAACGSYLISPWLESSSVTASSNRVPLEAAPNVGTWIGEVKAPLGIGRDNIRGYHFWIGGAPATAVVSNGTSAKATVEFVASIEIHSLVDRGRRTLVWEFEGQRSRRKVGVLARRRVCLPLPLGIPLVISLAPPLPVVEPVRIPLELPSGDHTLKLWVEQTAAPASSLANDESELRLLIGRFSLQRRVEKHVVRSNGQAAVH
jgi:hypothetical protein